MKAKLKFKSEKLTTPIHVVCGPTASGKTEYALNLAKELNGELINVDARQIYKYLDIGTNKGDVQHEPEVNTVTISNGEIVLPIYSLAGVPLHLISFLHPDQQWNAFWHRELVYLVISQIWERGKQPILVGGTGLYIDVIMHPDKYMEPNQSNADLRTELTGLSVTQLQTKLEEVAPGVLDQLNDSDRQNPRRLVRAIEKGLVEPQLQMNIETKGQEYEFQVHYRDEDMPELEARINRRVEQMFADGLVAEVQHVLDLGFPPTSIALQGIGYREVLRLLEGKINEDECIKLVQIAHRQYAKRQKTWFIKYL